MSRLRKSLVLGCLLLLTAGAQSAAASIAVGPSGLRFYNPPARLLAGKPGTVIWERTVANPSALPAARHTTLVLYRSVMPNGKPTAVSGVLFTPRGTAPKHGWKLISWAHGTTGIADVCAPTRTLSTDYMYSDFNGWLRKGYAVAQTDYQGLGTPGVHLYLVGRAEGASVDYMAVAARQVDKSIGSRFAIAGHSQGGQAALFAAAEVGQYARGLKFLGVAAFAPASHLKTQFQAAVVLKQPGGFLSAIGGLVVTSAAAASPAVDLRTLLTPQAYALVPQVNKVCLGALSQPNSWGGLAPDQIQRSGADTTALYRVLDGMNPALSIHAPVLILQGESDTTVFPVFTGQLDNELVALHDQVAYRKFPGVDHGGIVVAGYSAASSWLAKRFG